MLEKIILEIIVRRKVHISTGGTDPQSSDGECTVHKTQSIFMYLVGRIASFKAKVLYETNCNLFQYKFLKLKFKSYIIKIGPVWC